MARRMRRRLTFANVCSFLALTVALGTGGAYAANTIGSDDIIDESIQSQDIKDGAVRYPDIALNSITSGKLVNGQVTASDVGANAIDSSKVLNDSLTTADLKGVAVNGAASVSGIPNGRCAQVTFSVSGTQVGETPLVSTRAAIQNGIVFYAQRVSNPGQIEVNVCNFSGGAMTPLTDFPVRIVTIG
jgi:hypothetical protein